MFMMYSLCYVGNVNCKGYVEEFVLQQWVGLFYYTFNISKLL